MMVELIDDFFAEYPATAEQDGLIRQQVIEQNYTLRRRVSPRRGDLHAKH